MAVIRGVLLTEKIPRLLQRDKLRLFLEITNISELCIRQDNNKRQLVNRPFYVQNVQKTSFLRWNRHIPR